MLDRLRSDFQAGSRKVSSFQVLDDDLEPDRRGFKRSSVVLLDLEDDDFRAGRSPRRSEDCASSVAAAAAILAEDRASSSGAGSSQAEDSRLWLESSRESDKGNKTDKWYCDGPDCGKDISLGTRKDGAFHKQKPRYRAHAHPPCKLTRQTSGGAMVQVVAWTSAMGRRKIKILSS